MAEGGMTETEWLASDCPILKLSWDRGWPSPRKQRLLAVACCRRLLRLVPDAPRLERGLAVAERYADRHVKRTDLKAAQARLPRLQYAIRPRNRTYAKVLAQYAATAARWACEPGTRHYAGHAAMSAATATGYAALPPDEDYVGPAYSKYGRRWSAAAGAEKAVQLLLLRDVCGDPFHPIAPRAGRVGRDVLQLARACYDERLLPTGELDRRRLAVLADALEEAGGADRAILAHCRAPGPHVRGCWAIDLLLGKK
jgi:hypothetical protein